MFLCFMFNRLLITGLFAIFNNVLIATKKQDLSNGKTVERKFYSVK